MKFKSLFLTLCMLVIAGWALGQTVKVDGEIRPRAELRNGYSKLPATDAESAMFIAQRTRFNAFYGTKVFKTYVSFQDVRVWGDVPQLDKGAANRFGVHQAWGEYFFSEALSLKAGRQELVYDDSRILGNVGWATQARSHDIALFKYEKKNFKAHAGFAYNQVSEAKFGNDYLSPNNYKAMQFLWLHTKIGKSGLSFLLLNNGVESVDKVPTEEGDLAIYKVLYSQTIGARFTPTLGPVNLAAAAYYQMGNVGNDSTSLSAMYFALEGSIKAADNITVIAGFEYLSGTSMKDNVEDPLMKKSFAPLYGTNHKFNGHMDYFYVGNHAGNVGLIDLYATLKLKLGKFSVFATPHYFMAAADVYKAKGAVKADFNEDAYETLSKGLGIEVDAGVSYVPTKGVKFVLGASSMMGTETLGFLQGHMTTDTYSKNGSWAYAMVVFKPNFYSTK